jgi:hypothetical protein
MGWLQFLFLTKTNRKNTGRYTKGTIKVLITRFDAIAYSLNVAQHGLTYREWILIKNINLETLPSKINLTTSLLTGVSGNDNERMVIDNINGA